ncbi:hypothetical protein EVAR_70242_1 [Eumeta japonica]|uniref:Sodium/potassium/calcium exchanger 5 n=1 Tax=Eumeta variegata TaxID=151549 RepID=A0A4C2A1T2_EUMVA|nr:hypothetical protein EVAR_70242_1 [Eumeta japonica]
MVLPCILLASSGVIRRAGSSPNYVFHSRLASGVTRFAFVPGFVQIRIRIGSEIEIESWIGAELRKGLEWELKLAPKPKLRTDWVENECINGINIKRLARMFRVKQGSAHNCTLPAIDDFPVGFFTESQRQHGAIVIHAFISIYLFVALAVVCDKYFVPAVDKICQALNMTNDVAGATFMAAATSAPELFVNVIGTFITEGDIGVGTIVGSAVFNILAVAACCGIGAGMVVPLDWWPLTRDCCAYGITVSILICIMHDEYVQWYEAFFLVLLYGVYICIMYYDKSIQSCAKGSWRCMKRVFKCEDKTPNENEEITIEKISTEKSDTIGDHHQHNGNIKGLSVFSEVLNENPEIKLEEDVQKKKPESDYKADTEIVFSHIDENEVDDGRDEQKQACTTEESGDEYVHSLWQWPTGRGDTLMIPDSVMGITFLAAGTSVPEAVSSVIVAKQGHGSMGISNSIGSNTFDILLCLGLPWLIKASLIPTKEGHYWVKINSMGLEYSAISLLSTLLMLYLTFWFNKFKLDAAVGRACLAMYAVFLVLATLIELNVFFPVNVRTCKRTEKGKS